MGRKAREGLYVYVYVILLIKSKLLCTPTQLSKCIFSPLQKYREYKYDNNVQKCIRILFAEYELPATDGTKQVECVHHFSSRDIQTSLLHPP